MSNTPAKIGTGLPGPGRRKGSLNRTTATLKEALLLAAQEAGGGGRNGLKAFLLEQARKPNNTAFMAMLSRVLPMQVEADADDGQLVVVI